MNSRHIAWIRLRRIHAAVQLGLWSLLAAWVLLLVLDIPTMSAARSAAARQQVLEIAAENSRYCEKWGMPEGSHEHTLCTLDLQELHAKIARRLADEMMF